MKITIYTYVCRVLLFRVLYLGGADACVQLTTICGQLASYIRVYLYNYMDQLYILIQLNWPPFYIVFNGVTNIPQALTV